MSKRAYSYDEIFPERWLHAPDLDGRAVTLRIKEAYSEHIQDPKNHKKDDPGDLCGILAFHGTKREYVLSKQNAWILKTLWGKDPAAYVEKRITIAPVPDSSGFTEHGTRILFIGSPDVEHDLSLNLPGGRHLTFKSTVAGKQEVEEASVDSVTGEVATDAAPSTETALSGDSVPDEGTDADDDEPPGEATLPQGQAAAGDEHLFDAADPNRPAMKSDRAALSKALKRLPESYWRAHLNTTYEGKDIQDLTHGECEELCAWAVTEAVAG